MSFKTYQDSNQTKGGFLKCSMKNILNSIKGLQTLHPPPPPSPLERAVSDMATTEALIDPISQ